MDVRAGDQPLKAVEDAEPSVRPRLSSWQLAVKRGADLAFSIAILPLAVPIGIISAAMIKLDSPGPVFFKQTRIGKDGRPFLIYKFRSMYVNADELVSKLGHLNEAEGPIFKIKKDPRITKVGAIWRKASLDELPQIINILKGDMSLVGPRPPLPREVEKYNACQRGRLAVKPGLTCLWQIQGRSSIPFEKWVELDLEYIRNQSLWLDVKILLKTIPAVLKGTGAW
ncbi:MAG TPA: sugar transferase [Armatimonadota bacterium]|nr:sugar transferase [Armatimonadota bacterium]